MTPAELAQRMRDARRRWLELDERRALWVERPSDEGIYAFREALRGPEAEEGVALQGKRVDIAKALSLTRDHVVGWRGFTEADLLPPGVGGDTPVPFDREVFNEWARNESSAVSRALELAIGMDRESIASAEDVAKNSSSA